VKTDQILQKMQTAQNLRWQDAELAEVFARSALEDAQALGCVSASLHFLLADILDDQQKDLQGFTEVTEAVRLDPFHPGARELAGNIAKRLRTSLRSALRSADDPAIPRMYTVLAREGETTLACHLTMIRYALATGDIERASSVAEAVVALYPGEEKAWTALAEASRAAGNETRASEAEFQLGVLGLSPVLPGPDWAKA
jgi:hypothetical protein